MGSKLLLGRATAGLCHVAVTDAYALSVPETVSAMAEAALPGGPGAKAQDGKSADDWRFGATFYGWATSPSGSATARGNTVDFNASIIDIFQESDAVAAWDSYFEAAKGRFSAYLDVVWSKVQLPKSAASYGNPIGGVTTSAASAFPEAPGSPGSSSASTATRGNSTAMRSPRSPAVVPFQQTWASAAAPSTLRALPFSFTARSWASLQSFERRLSNRMSIPR